MIINEHGKWAFMGGVNPRPVSLTFGDVVSAAVDATQASYTVQKGRAAVLTGASLFIRRVGIPSVAGNAKVIVRITKIDGRVFDVFSMLMFTTSTSQQSESSLPFNVPLNAGDIVELVYDDLSTGGSCTISMSASLTEFDF